MKTTLAALLALGLVTSAASARTVFDDLRDTAPRSPFDQIRDSAPRSDGVYGDLENSAP